MRKGRVDSRFSINKASMLRCLVLFAVIGITSAVFAANDVANTVSVWDKIINFVKHYGYGLIVDVRGNAVWAFMVRIPLVSFILVVIGFSFFSQRLHVYLFLYGSWYGIPRFWGTAFGKIVSNSDTRLYRRFESPDRKRVVNRLNAHGGVFLVMGPPGVGKSLMVRAESKAKYVLAVDRDDWYDSHEDAPVKGILKERTTLLVKNLIFKKPVCIVLTWNSGLRLTPVPNKYRMEQIVDQLLGILSESKNFRMVSFVVIVPAYYQLDSRQREDGRYCGKPEEHSVNRLNCSECLSLLDAQLKYKANKDGLDAAQVRRTLRDKARDGGLSLERMVWIESFGMPKHVVDIVGRQQYKSSKVWESLRDWWCQVYDANEKEEWLVYLYVIALVSLVDKHPVDAVALAQKLFGNRSRLVEKALRRICVKPRPAIREKGVSKECSTVRKKAKFFDERPFSLRKLMPELIFEDPYVVESLVGSLGCLLDESGEKIFDFRDQIGGVVKFRDQMDDADKNKQVFLLDDIVECEKLADVYMVVAERFPDLAQRLSEQYALLGRLEEAFGTCKLVEAYGRRLRDPVVFQDFVRVVISRIGALPDSLFAEMLDSINDTLREYNSTSEYAILIFEMLPVYVLSGLLPYSWKVDFEILQEEMCATGSKDDTQFKCAAMISVAYALYRREDVFGRDLSQAPDLQASYRVVSSAFSRVSEIIDDKTGYWSIFRQILLIIDRMAQGGSLPTFDIASLPPYVKRTWLSVFIVVMRLHTEKDLYRSVDVVAIVNGLSDVGLSENDRILAGWCRSQLPYWYDADKGSADWVRGLEIDVKYTKGVINRWMADCPIVAISVFERMCCDFRVICKNGMEALWDPNALEDLLRILRDSPMVMSEISCVQCLRIFAWLLCGIAEGKVCIDLGKTWSDLAKIVKESWMPFLSGEKSLSDRYPYIFFHMYLLLSKVKTISISTRKTLLQEITPTRYMYSCVNADRIGCAWNVYNCDNNILRPYIKILWCAQIMAGKTAALLSNDSAEMILVAEDLIKEARAIDERNVDEELVRKLYEINGLLPESQVEKEEEK